MTASRFSRLFLVSAFIKVQIIEMISRISLLTYMRMSSATWSFLERPVCRRLPVSPMRSVSSCSIFMWMSS